VRDRHGATLDHVLPALEAPTFARVMCPVVATDALLLSDGFADDTGLLHIARGRRRSGQPLPTALVDKLHNPVLALQPPDIDIEVHPVDPFDRKLDMVADDPSPVLSCPRFRSCGFASQALRPFIGSIETGFTHEPATRATTATCLVGLRWSLVRNLK
jgi:hypothetical protein